MTSALVTTRQALHSVAELVLAGPQYRTHGTIRLRVADRGFATSVGPEVRVDGTAVQLGERRGEITGRTATQLADLLGLTACSLGDVYPSATGLGFDDLLEVGPDEAAYIAACLAAGNAALAAFAPAADPVVWPEHFDIGVTVDEINYGVSPGDAGHEQPYAYVSPHSVPSGRFWNEPFGASIQLGDPPDVAAIIEFFTAGRRTAPRHSAS
jgi:hypothetical protein